MDRTPASVSSNGTAPHPPTAVDHDGSLAALRTTPENVHLFRGYGPLVVGIILFVLMVTLAPTVAPEHTVERPVGGTSTTTTSTTVAVATEATP